MPDLDPSRLLVVGGGGREHALVWLLGRTEAVSKVYVAPGNAGTARERKAENVDIADTDVERLVAFASDQRVSMTVVGPEAPIALGIVDRFREAGLPVFGPTQAAARLETSKGWARDFMARHGVPQPAYVATSDLEAAERAVAGFGGRCVVKADGLAAGKGVVVCDGPDEALAALRGMLVERTLGEAGASVVVEERLEGTELSVMAVTDGKAFIRFPAAQDNKRLLDGDRGPNTGGMGAFTPTPLATREMLDDVREQIIRPTIDGMAAEGTAFTGCLFCGLMITTDGPKVLEFNARFGDPETQVQLPLLDSDLTRVMQTATALQLADAQIGWNKGRAAVCVVLAAEGYPERPKTGFVIHGLDEAAARPNIKIFHAGTRRMDGDITVAGGRVLNVVATADTLAEATAAAYAAIGEGGLRFRGMQFRTDIAASALR